jgi:5-methylcytosine-specific restriction endonuclease McrA
MLRTDNKAQLVKLPWTLSRMLSGRRYAVQSGRKIMELRWSKAQVGAAQTAQATEPLHVWRDGRRNLWQFLDCFYWDDDDLDAEDIKALVMQRKRRLEQKVRSARSLMRAEENGRPTRVAIPTELRRAVYERDGGRCLEWAGTFDLQYDHILPVAHGGAMTPTLSASPTLAMFARATSAWWASNSRVMMCPSAGRPRASQIVLYPPSVPISSTRREPLMRTNSSSIRPCPAEMGPPDSPAFSLAASTASSAASSPIRRPEA